MLGRNAVQWCQRSYWEVILSLVSVCQSFCLFIGVGIPMWPVPESVQTCSLGDPSSLAMAPSSLNTGTPRHAPPPSLAFLHSPYRHPMSVPAMPQRGHVQTWPVEPDHTGTTPVRDLLKNGQFVFNWKAFLFRKNINLELDPALVGIIV